MQNLEGALYANIKTQHKIYVLEKMHGEIWGKRGNRHFIIPTVKPL